MEILKVNLQYGSKCYLRHDGAIREAIFNGTKCVDKVNGGYAYCYMLDIAGIGERLVEFDRFHTFDDWYRNTTCKTCLYPTINDCVNHRNAISANFGSVSNAWNAKFMRPYFPNFSVCDCGGYIHSYAWDGTQAVFLSAKLNDRTWTMDKYGFRIDEPMNIIWSVQGAYRTFGRFYPTKTYRTKQECEADNTPIVVTF